MITGQAELKAFLSQARASGKKIFAYAGFDPTANSLHIGHLGVISMLQTIQNAGHDVVAVLGTSTATIGDPTGKTAARTVLEKDTIHENAKGVRNDLERFGLQIIENSWLANLNFQEFMREVGSKIPLNMLLNLSLVKTRIESGVGISLMEATYPILQGWDMAVLARRAKDNGADIMVQVGGVDQTGNISVGIHLTHRTVHDIEAEGVLVPLVCGANGVKMGKSEGNALFLSPEKTDDFALHNTLLSLPDDIMTALWSGVSFDVDISVLNDECAALPGDLAANIKRRQVDDVFRLIRGDAALRTLAQGKTTLSEYEFTKPLRLVEILTNVGLSSSLGEGRRLIDGGGIKIDDVPVQKNTDGSDIVIVNEGIFKLQRGKKRCVMVNMK